MSVHYEGYLLKALRTELGINNTNIHTNKNNCKNASRIVKMCKGMHMHNVIISRSIKRIVRNFIEFKHKVPCLTTNYLPTLNAIIHSYLLFRKDRDILLHF